MNFLQAENPVECKIQIEHMSSKHTGRRDVAYAAHNNNNYSYWKCFFVIFTFIRSDAFLH